jgi:hypothetical protein
MDDHLHDLLGGMLIALVIAPVIMSPLLIYRLVKWLQSRDKS